LTGLAAAMSLLPEEFPVVLTVFMALGAWRLARRNVLTRRVAAIEALGAISALCVDKSGTLTQNQMTVRKLWQGGEEVDLQARDSTEKQQLAHLAEIAALAYNPSPFDPMERAILQ
jgi:P-type Ca2+ transporter type 2C